MQLSGPLQYYLDVFQGPSLQFIERLTAAVEQQVKKDYTQEEVVESMAFTPANEKCKAAV